MDQASHHEDEFVPTPLRVMEEYARHAARRDELAERRDSEAEERDHAADQRDSAITEIEVQSGSENGSALGAALRYAEALRREAANDRRYAALDRGKAAEDRAQAAAERSEALAALRGVHLDDLTGALRRGFGEEALRLELERARRAGHGLLLAMLDVDGLKEINDTRGHLAGDQLLRDVVGAIRANIRAYEPLVRFGGDEFVFTMAGMDTDGLRQRLTVIRADLARRPSRGRFTVGVAEHLPGDDLADLIRRADEQLISARRQSRIRPR